MNTHLLVVPAYLDTGDCSLVLLEGLFHVLSLGSDLPHSNLPFTTTTDERSTVRGTSHCRHTLWRGLMDVLVQATRELIDYVRW